MSRSFELESPDHFTAGAVGPPGERVFYLQARENGEVLTLKTEKEQVRGLAEYLEGLLAKSPVAPEEIPRDVALLEPIDPAWSVGAIGVGYDEAEDRIIVVVNELVLAVNAALAGCIVEPPPDLVVFEQANVQPEGIELAGLYQLAAELRDQLPGRQETA